MKPFKPFFLTTEAEAEALKKRLESAELSVEDRDQILKAIDFYLQVRSSVLKAMNPRYLAQRLLGFFPKKRDSLPKAE